MYNNLVVQINLFIYIYSHKNYLPSVYGHGQDVNIFSNVKYKKGGKLMK